MALAASRMQTYGDLYSAKFFFKKGTKLERLQLKCKKISGIFLRIEKERELERQRE